MKKYFILFILLIFLNGCSNIEEAKDENTRLLYECINENSALKIKLKPMINAKIQEVDGNFNVRLPSFKYVSSPFEFENGEIKYRLETIRDSIVYESNYKAKTIEFNERNGYFIIIDYEAIRDYDKKSFNYTVPEIRLITKDKEIKAEFKEPSLLDIEQTCYIR